MRAKNLGRHELLSWVNTTVQSDYSKIENLSDGIAYCQIIEAYYANSIDVLKLKCKNH
jgi:RP/EB family microtubule-associated protein